MISETRSQILVGVDFSDAANLALREAIVESARRGQSDLHVVSLIDDSTFHLFRAADHDETLSAIVDGVRDRVTYLVGRAIADDRKEHPDAPALTTTVHVRIGNIADQLVALATEISADLLIVGSHGTRGVRQWILGSVAERVMRLAPCPVLVIRPKNLHALDGLPKIEPPCPACVRARVETNGQEWWCVPHRAAPSEAHTYSYSGRLLNPEAPRNHML